MRVCVVEKFQRVLLGVWREAGRHIEIGQSAQTIAAMLTDDMPVGQLVVRKADPRRESVETVAVGFPEYHAVASSVTPCPAPQFRRLARWMKKGGEVCRHAAGDALDARMKLVYPFEEERDFLAGAFEGPDGTVGFLVLVAADGRSFTARHRELAGVLLDPFAAAMANDHRLREMALLRQAAEAENRSLLKRLGRERLDDAIVGDETGLADVMGRVELVAKSDAPVLIFGETGTGKELVARAIHVRSARSQGPVLRVNCGAIPPELVDSELFGHERGAFTGAVESRKGWFERADGGTLFLDEIGELPPAAQVRLLRILQDGWLERVGGEEPVHVDVRIVAATHRDLAEMVARGEFRADLWYRISVFPLVLPPLRERREDIAELARHFARRAAVRLSLPEILPTDDDIRMLASYSWPGNVRELASVINRAAILGNGQRLEIETALGVIDAGVKPRPLEASRPRQATAGIASLDEVIRQHIEAALASASGQVEGPRGAAAMLDINPNTLRGKMRKLKIDWRKFRED
jgi:transcriptional regulator with GAF, ATPase, and Fis domain